MSTGPVTLVLADALLPAGARADIGIAGPTVPAIMGSVGPA